MKIRTLLLASAFLCISLLASCSSENHVSSTSSSQGNQRMTTDIAGGHQQITSPAEGALTSSTPVPPVTQLATPSYSETDIAAYNGAMKLNDASFCEKISDDEYKKECRTNLADQKALDDALIKIDPIICDQLSTADKKESCKVQVEVAKKRNADQA